MHAHRYNDYMQMTRRIHTKLCKGVIFEGWNWKDLKFVRFLCKLQITQNWVNEIMAFT